MNNMDEIKEYGEDIQDFEVSPFEMVKTLQWRSHIVKVYVQLSIKEKGQLAMYDLILLSNARKTYETLVGDITFQRTNQLKSCGGIWIKLLQVVSYLVLLKRIVVS